LLASPALLAYNPPLLDPPGCPANLKAGAGEIPDEVDSLANDISLNPSFFDALAITGALS